jgi:hypothetical protein
MGQSRGVSVNPVIGAVIVLAALVIIGVPLGRYLWDELHGEDGEVRVTLEIVSPSQGETLRSPVILEMKSTGVEVTDPGEGKDGSLHYHAFVDIHPITAGGQVIPQAGGIHHFWEDTLELELAPGPHTIIVTLGDNGDVRPSDTPTVLVDFLVSE